MKGTPPAISLFFCGGEGNPPTLCRFNSLQFFAFAILKLKIINETLQTKYNTMRQLMTIPENDFANFSKVEEVRIG